MLSPKMTPIGCLLIVMLLCCDSSMCRASAPVSTTTSIPDQQPDVFRLIADEIAKECQTGSLILSEGDCLAVRMFTWSSVTHVAVVIFHDGVPYVYDSTSGIGVRRQELADYLRGQGLEEIHLLHPGRPLTAEEAANLESALTLQLGRPYAVAHHLTGQRCSGVHCAEYLTDSLIAIDWLRAENPVKVSPSSLAEGLLLHEIYVPGRTVPLPVELTPIPEATGWCSRAWAGTKHSLATCCSQLSGWVLCR